MRYLKDAEIPVLPMNGLVAGETVAFGVYDPGVIVHLLESDKCLLISWEDIIVFGKEMTKAGSVPPKEPVEISKPTKEG
jgi:hypothetical protein